MVNWFYHRGATQRRSHLNNHISWQTRQSRLIATASVAAWMWPSLCPNLAVSCHRPCQTLPLRCRFLPLLPPITRHVKFVCGANRLECGIGEENAPNAKCKSGKNGNVHRASQLCHLLSSLLSPP